MVAAASKQPYNNGSKIGSTIVEPMNVLCRLGIHTYFIHIASVDERAGDDADGLPAASDSIIDEY